ncbi:MAG: winged helix-turn-helix transcriptional regulator [Thermoplasmata archaeon]|nr:winged helix-turn-helix transcriptional regulator [Candidatus Sysuiplasma acidicola]
MKEEIALTILARIFNGSYSVRELTRATGYSPNTVVSYLNELESRGLIKKEKTRKLSRGRPPVILRGTAQGIKWYRTAADALFYKLNSEKGVLWGPRSSFARLGIAFVGSEDILSRKPVETRAFEVVVGRSPLLYEDPIITTDGSFMSPKGLLLWATESGEPRKIAAAVSMMKSGKVKDKDAVDVAIRGKQQNAIGFLASLAGKSDISRKLKPTSEKVKLLAFQGPQDPETLRLADRWHVLNPISRNDVDELMQTYGGKLAPDQTKKRQHVVALVREGHFETS